MMTADKMRSFSIIALLGLLAACDRQGATNAATTEDIKSETANKGDEIILLCKGKQFDFNKVSKPASMLLRIQQPSGSSRSIGWYSDKDKGFLSLCEEKPGVCSLSVDADRITEVRVINDTDGSPSYVQQTVINRLTGEMQQTSKDSRLGDSIQIEAICEKSEAPAKQPAKF